MIIYPNLYIENITKINKEIIEKYEIKAMLLDIDNTILPVNDINVPVELIDFINKLKNKFNICIC